MPRRADNGLPAPWIKRALFPVSIPTALAAKAVISTRVLDALIRNKLASLPDCGDVEPMPVVRAAGPNGCNWKVPGWVGDSRAVARCEREMEKYLAFLASQFNVSDSQ